MTIIKKVVVYFHKLWYYLYDRLGNDDKMKKGIVDAKVLACYITDKYKQIGGTISPIKLQKSLYFCFAYWGGFVRKSKIGNSEMNVNYSEILFDNKIEAWVYGPVVPDVFHEKNLDSYRSKKANIFPDEFVKNYIDGILDDVLRASDFKLVEISHKDKCYQKNFKKTAFFHNNVINPEDIIKEYARI